MISEPKIVTRGEQPYAAIKLTVMQPEIGQKAPPLHDPVMDYIKGQGEAPVGAPYFNYTRMKPNGEMDMEVGWPTAKVLPASGQVITGKFPAGRYATLTYTGPYDGLYNAHEQLHVWLGKQGMVPHNWGDGSKGGATLLEVYESDPGNEPDPQKWVTDIFFKLPD